MKSKCNVCTVRILPLLCWLTFAIPAQALTIDTNPTSPTYGKIVNWGFTPFGTGPYMGNWANGAPPLTDGKLGTDYGTDSVATWAEGNNSSPINYYDDTSQPYVPSPGNSTTLETTTPHGEAYDIELLAWRKVNETQIQVLAITSMDPKSGVNYYGWPLHLGDVFIDVDGNGVYDRALISGQWHTYLFDPDTKQPYDHKMPIGIYSIDSLDGVHRITGTTTGYYPDKTLWSFDFGYANNSAINARTMPFTLNKGTNQGGNLVYSAQKFNYGTSYYQDTGIQVSDENNTWILEWTFDIAALGPLPVDPATGQPTLKKLKLHLTNECGNDLLEDQPLGEIGDTVYWDQNNNGVQDTGEPGLAGVTVVLTNPGPDGMLFTSDDQTLTTVTDHNGLYHFRNLIPGSYAITVQDTTLPTGFQPGTVNYHEVFQVDLQPADTFENADFNYIQYVSIGNTVYCDANNDGVQDDSETGIASATVTLTKPDGTQVAQVISDGNGQYLFSNLPPGTYGVAVTSIPAGYAPARQAGPYTIPLAVQGTSNLNADFGLYLPARLGDFVYQDLNNNGRWDAGEPPLAGVPLTLYTANANGSTVGSPLATTTSDTDGIYHFSNLAPGSYKIVATTPAGLVATQVATSPIVLTSGMDYKDADFGFHNFGPVAAGDTATIGFWHNKNGQTLINALNGGPTMPNLATWLATTFPFLYGPQSSKDLTSKTNVDVAALFQQFFAVKGQKTEAQMLGAALAVYVTDSDLAYSMAARYGFNVTAAGAGAKTCNVGSYGATIGLANNTQYTVLQLLQQANLQKQLGTFNANAFNSIFDAINTKGDIK